MIKQGKLTEKILAQLATLSREIEYNGLIGYQNIHKQSENFIAKLLNVIYGYRLENFGDKPNFSGLDIGDEAAGIAYQVSADKTSEKVNETLLTCIADEHYKTFKSINFFMLLGKQGKYTIKVDTSPYFPFDDKINIIDFNDLVRKIQHLDTAHLEKISKLLDTELLSYLSTLKPEEHSAPENPHLIDIATSRTRTGLNFYSHFRYEINILDETISVAQLHKRLSSYLDNQRKKEFIPIFNAALQVKVNSREYTFKYGPKSDGPVNSGFEMGLKLTPGKICYEFAYFYSQELMITNLRREFDCIILLINFLGDPHPHKNVHLAANLNITTNGKLAFQNMSSNFLARGGMDNYVLDPAEVSYSVILNSDVNSNLFKLMELIIEGFVAEMGYGNNQVFLEFNEKQQKTLLSEIRRNFITIML
ncbi:MAG: hypothetical protein DI535_03800 [Citrobacter freundii]|nr:MAG: hypothetical protein DI535_03800 [Citrobacter freundii]